MSGKLSLVRSSPIDASPGRTVSGLSAVASAGAFRGARLLEASCHRASGSCGLKMRARSAATS
jgi:hypothetical protein